MEKNIVLAGVGGQGILSIAFCVCNAALRRGWNFKQAEVHGMSQRGGAVESHVRLADRPIHSDMVPLGKADVVLSVEPLEVLRYVQFLASDGVLMSSVSPFVNIPNYPEMDEILGQISQFKHHVLIDSKRLATEAGSGRADNMIMLGAAAEAVGFAVSEFDPFIEQLFAKKSERIVEVNCRALRMGQLAAQHYAELRDKGIAAMEAIQQIEQINLADELTEFKLEKAGA